MGTGGVSPRRREEVGDGRCRRRKVVHNVTTPTQPATLWEQLNSWAESPTAVACGERGTHPADRTAVRSGRRRGERGASSAAHSLAPSPSANPVGDRGSIARHRSPAVISTTAGDFRGCAPRAALRAAPSPRPLPPRESRRVPPGEIATGRGFSLAPFCLLGRPGASCAPGSVFSGQYRQAKLWGRFSAQQTLAAASPKTHAPPPCCPHP